MGEIQGYNVKRKKKVVMTKVVIDITKNNRYFAKGEDEDTGDVVCVAMGKEKAVAAIEDGDATKGKGW